MKCYYLNQVATVGAETFLDVASFEECNGEALDEGPCFAGLDLSETTDLTALALFFPETGRLDIHAFIPQEPSLDERSARDDLPYKEYKDMGFIKYCGKKIIDFGLLAKYVSELAEKYQIEKITVDPYRVKAFEAAVEREEVWMPELEKFTQNYLMMSPAIAALERLFVNGYIRHGGNPVLKRALMNCQVIRDGKNNRMFSKLKSTGRIDPVVAAAMAVVQAEEIIDNDSTKYYSSGADLVIGV